MAQVSALIQSQRTFSRSDFPPSIVLNIVTPQRRFATRWEAHFTTEHVYIISIGDCRMLLETREFIAIRFELLPLTSCCKKRKICIQISNERLKKRKGPYIFSRSQWYLPTYKTNLVLKFNIYKHVLLQNIPKYRCNQLVQ